MYRDGIEVVTYDGAVTLQDSHVLQDSSLLGQVFVTHIQDTLRIHKSHQQDRAVVPGSLKFLAPLYNLVTKGVSISEIVYKVLHHHVYAGTAMFAGMK